MLSLEQVDVYSLHPRKSHEKDVILNVPRATFIYSDFSPPHPILHLFSIHLYSDFSPPHPILHLFSIHLFMSLVALYTCIVIYVGQVSAHFYHDIHDSKARGFV